MLTHKNLVTAALRVDTGPRRRQRRHPALPAARAQLRPPRAPVGRATTARRVAFVAEAARVSEALATVRPTILPAVPRVYEKIHSNALGEIERERRREARDRPLGTRRRRGRRAASAAPGKPVPGAAPRCRSASPTGSSSRRCRQRLGGRLRVGVSGAAPLGARRARVLPLARACSWSRATGSPRPRARRRVNEPDDFRFGTVGRAVEGCELMLDRGRRDPRPQRHDLRRLLQGARGDRRGVHRGRLVPHRRRRRDRRGRLPEDHRPQEGPDHHRRRQEHRAAEPRERAQGVALRLAGARRRRPAPVRRSR